MTKIIFKDISGYEGLYKISNDGLSVICYPKTHTIINRWNFPVVINKPEKQVSINLSGRYKRLALIKPGNVSYQSLHRLVALTFIPNPNNLPQVNHKDGNRFNNHVDNLEWCTASHNMQHAFDTGLINPENLGKGMKGVLPKTAIVILDLYTGIFYECMKEAEASLNMTANTFRYYFNGKSKNSPKGQYLNNRFLRA